MKIPGYIEWAKSQSTGKEFPVFIACADIDYVTDGLCSVTSITDNLIVVGQATSDEYKQGPREGAEEFQRRANEALSREDLRAVHVEEVVEQNIDVKKLSFQEYLKQDKPPRILYTDIYATDGKAEAVREQSIEDFISEGGRVEIIHMDCHDD